MKFSDYLVEQNVIEEGLKLANTPKIKKALLNFVKSKIDKARQRDPEIATVDKTSIVKLQELVEEFAVALGTWTTVSPDGTMGFTGQYGHGKDAWKNKKEIMNKKELGTSIIVVNIMKELSMNTDKKNAIADFEKQLTDIAIKNI